MIKYLVEDSACKIEGAIHQMEYNRNQNKSRNDRGNRDNRDNREGAKKPRFAQGGPERGDKSRRGERKADAKPYAKNNAD